MDMDVLNHILTKLTEGHVLREQPARLKHKDGSVRHVVINTSANFDSAGNFINTRCFTRDVTETRELELQAKAAEIQAKAAQDALLMKSLFLARMSHDIRTPLNGVIGMTSMLQTTQLNQEQNEFVDVIESSSKFLLNLIQDILDHSKIEAGQIDLDICPYNIAKVIKKYIISF
jgi:signal transduction histidine kinase